MIARRLYLAAGWGAIALGTMGIALPLLPTVPFMILAAFCFARSSPEMEARLMNHRHFGPHIRRWRDHGAITRRGKIAASIAFAASAAIGLAAAPFPWSLAPTLAAIIGATWIWTRPVA